MCSLSWCLPCGFRHPIPYFYAVYFAVLLSMPRHPLACCKVPGDVGRRHHRCHHKHPYAMRNAISMCMHLQGLVARSHRVLSQQGYGGLKWVLSMLRAVHLHLS